MGFGATNRAAIRTSNHPKETTMRRLLPLFLFLLALPAWAYHDGISVNFNDDGTDITDCSQIRMTVDGRPAATEQENVPLGAINSLKLDAARNGGIRVRGGYGGYSVVACKGAALSEQLRAIHVSTSGNHVTADGPSESRDWTVYFLVQVPRNATLDLSSTNGPISVKDVTGTVAAQAQNGPIAVKNSSGTIDVQSKNGPIAFAGDAGTVKLRANNGPIAVKLAGNGWNGGSLDARTDNGPLAVKLPRSYASGVVIESNGRGPVVCKADACGGKLISLDESRRKIELGHGTALVHLATGNGPISIKDE
jgi:hypothetical protein